MPPGRDRLTFKPGSWTQTGEKAMDETYRMLGREHDLERETRTDVLRRCS
jgi:hypothetical protein